jgi:ABC-type transport system substrate-binding protein
VVVEAVPGPGGIVPPLARLVFLPVPDAADGLARLGTGGGLDLHFPAEPPPDHPGLQVLTGPSARVGLLALRADRGVLARKPVRQAVSLALDPTLIDPALGRWAAAATGLLPPAAWGARETPRPGHDPGRARRLVTEAGARDAPLTLAAGEGSPGADVPRLVEAVRVSLATAGLAVRARVEPEEAAAATRAQGDFDLALVETGSPVNDPHAALAPLLAPEASGLGGGNLARLRSPALEGLLSRAAQLGFRPERLRLYHRLQALLAEEVPYVPLYVRRQWAVARPGVRGLRLDPWGLHRLERVWVEGEPAR